MSLMELKVKGREGFLRKGSKILYLDLGTLGQEYPKSLSFWRKTARSLSRTSFLVVLPTIPLLVVGSKWEEGGLFLSILVLFSFLLMSIPLMCLYKFCRNKVSKRFFIGCLVLMGTGAIFNFSVILSNGGYMPVYPYVDIEEGKSGSLKVTKTKLEGIWIEVNGDTNLSILADGRFTGDTSKVRFSLGDIFLVLGPVLWVSFVVIDSGYKGLLLARKGIKMGLTRFWVR